VAKSWMKEKEQLGIEANRTCDLMALAWRHVFNDLVVRT
jgi:hypothetical protein